MREKLEKRKRNKSRKQKVESRKRIKRQKLKIKKFNKQLCY